MFLRTITAGLLAAVIAAVGGCYSMPHHAHSMGASGGCGVYADTACGSCGPSGYRRGYFLNHVTALLTMGSGCGDVYWGEWTNHPPDACDPCDNYGNWTGHGYGGGGGAYYGGWTGGAYDPGWNPLPGLPNLWGYRFADSGYAADCSTCEAGTIGMDYGLDYDPIEMLPAEVAPPPNGESRLKPPAAAPKPKASPASPPSREASTRTAHRPAPPAAYISAPRR